MAYPTLTAPSDVAQRFLGDYRDNTIVAATALALRLMADDKASFKSGYSLEAAARTAAHHFADPELRGEIVRRLTVEADDSYAEPPWS